MFHAFLARKDVQLKFWQCMICVVSAKCSENDFTEGRVVKPCQLLEAEAGNISNPFFSSVINCRIIVCAAILA